MTPYRNAIMEVFKPDGASYHQHCRVRQDMESIRLEYEEGGIAYAYAGRARGEGHYELEAEGFQGRATLHAFSGSIILDGAWQEEGAYGMWRIRLIDTDKEIRQ